VTPLSILILITIGAVAGSFGALVGVGGGVVITPILAMYFGLPIHQAIGVSLVAVIATSTASSSVHVERQTTDMRLGMTLELATTVGAAIAAVIAGYIHRRALAIIFVCFLVYSATNIARRMWATRNEESTQQIPAYTVRNYPFGMLASVFAGGFSGLLGVGGGVIKVPLMIMMMGVPLRVATATSNFMIGVTAATSAYIYYGRGDVNVAYAAPVVAGVFLGSLAGATFAPKVPARMILGLFLALILVMAAQMTMKIIGGQL
jgi:uncharacterized protein